MKKVLFSFLLLAGASLLSGAENLLVNPAGADNFKGFYRTRNSGFSAKDGVISVTGVADAKVNSYMKIQQNINLKGGKLPGGVFELSGKAKTGKITGTCQIAIREAQGKSGTYHGVKFTKWDGDTDWKEFKVVFTADAKATELSFYLLGYYLGTRDLVQIKDLQLVRR